MLSLLSEKESNIQEQYKNIFDSTTIISGLIKKNGV